MPSRAPYSAADNEAQLERFVAELFRQNGWQILVEPHAHGLKPDLVAERFGKQYIIEIKRASEGRKDRIIPLLSQAILESQSFARHSPGSAFPVAIVIASYIPESVAVEAKRFVQEHAPEVAVGLIDLEGFRSFAGHELEGLSVERPRGSRPPSSRLRSGSPHLFSDLNQWLLKVVLAPSIPDSYLAAPRQHFQGASQLAEAAGVSVMSAFRFVEQLSKAGFLEQEPGRLRLVRWRDLFERWPAASQSRVVDIPMRWILRRGNDALADALRSYVLASEGERSNIPRPGAPPVAPRARACLGLFSAAEALGIGFVHGVQPYVYLERMNDDAIESLGLSAHGAEEHPDVWIRIPKNRESVFRGAVMKKGVPVSDIVQVWLDIAHHPSRGKEQADLIWRRILAPALEANEQ
jgi:Holliday junction resolvase